MKQKGYWFGWAVITMMVTACSTSHIKTIPVSFTSAGSAPQVNADSLQVARASSASESIPNAFEALSEASAEEDPDEVMADTDEALSEAENSLYPNVTEGEEVQTPEGMPYSLGEVTYDVPVQLNARVEKMMRFYLEQKRSVLERGLRRSGRYLPMAQRFLSEAGMPKDLAYLMAVESNYNPHARSHANAVGLWQFIPGTARHYKLNANRWIDERFDAISSTKAAIRYLKVLYERFDSWELALASYNAGEGRVQKAIDKALAAGAPTDFWSLDLPAETKDYVPAFMALTIISKNPEYYRLSHITPEAPMDESRVTLATEYSLQEVAERAQMSLKELLSINPVYIKGTPPLTHKEYTLYLPNQNRQQLLQSLATLPQPFSQWKTLVANSDQSPRMTQLLANYGQEAYIRIKAGDTLSKLAKRHETTAVRLAQWNGLSIHQKLQTNQKLKLYLPTWQVFARMDEASGAVIAKISAKKASEVPVLVSKKNTPVKVEKIASLAKGSIAPISKADKSVTKAPVIAQREASKASLVKSPKSSKIPEKSPSSKTEAFGKARLAALAELTKQMDQVRSSQNKKNQPKLAMKEASSGKLSNKLVVEEDRSSKKSSPLVVIVKKGETLQDIARAHQTSIAKLVALNDLKPGTSLRRNQKILVPQK